MAAAGPSVPAGHRMADRCARLTPAGRGETFPRCDGQMHTNLGTVTSQVGRCTPGHRCFQQESSRRIPSVVSRTVLYPELCSGIFHKCPEPYLGHIYVLGYVETIQNRA
ncbi:hypothetical protein Bbelb_231040 [Branchiostoma belcheri]|nr:hypothetical protein Bbelb_231040 [Branchiostoma belcheri]